MTNIIKVYWLAATFDRLVANVETIFDNIRHSDPIHTHTFTGDSKVKKESQARLAIQYVVGFCLSERT